LTTEEDLSVRYQDHLEFWERTAEEVLRVIEDGSEADEIDGTIEGLMEEHTRAISNIANLSAAMAHQASTSKPRQTSIAALKLSARIANALRHGGVKSIEALEDLPRTAIAGIQYMPKGAPDKIAAALLAYREENPRL
jgi:DNA-directed RNA polymerase alpha subunit